MIRIATEEDLPRILEIYRPYVQNTTYSFEYTPPDYETFLQRFRGFTEQFPWLVYEEDGVILGYAYASAPFSRAAYRWCCEPSIYLVPEAQHKGIGRKLYAALEAILKLQGYRISYAIVTSENTGSVDFHMAVGYTHLADFPVCGYKFDRWLGITWLQKELNSVKNPSIFPVSWRAIVKDDRILQDILADLSIS